MKIESILIPVILGGLVVLQAGLNRKIAQGWGLPSTVLFNATVLLISACLLYFYTKQDPNELLQQTNFDFSKFNWWYILPGIFGLTLVFGTPFAIGKWGATHTFVILVSAQLITSIAWDILMESKEISWQRMAGCGLAWLGVFLANS